MMSGSVIFIITHEQIAMCLQRATEKILGKQEHLFPYTNLEDSLPVLIQKINQNILDLKPEHIVCFVDLAGGSCWNLANMLHKEHKNVTIISGVNMPMLISYFTNLNEMPFEELIKKVLKDGSRGILHVEGAS
jgi:fructoselysine and glucoselysine-specific PTS system IIA component